MKERIKPVVFSIAAALLLWVVSYCEVLQDYPLIGKFFPAGSAAVLFVGFISAYFVLSRLIFPNLKGRTLREGVSLILVSVILAVCLMVWLPVPDRGLMPVHRLEVRSLSDEPLLLTWLNTEQGDVSLKTFSGEGAWELTDEGILLTDRDAVIRWQGKTGKTSTVEFRSGTDCGSASFAWDGKVTEVGLYNEELERISYDTAFPPNNGLPEFLAVFILLFLAAAGIYCQVFFAEKHLSREAAFVLMLAVFVILRVLQYRTMAHPVKFIDSESYIGTSLMSVGEILRGTDYCYPQYWYCIKRAALIPLFYKLCRQNYDVIVAAQSALSVLAWAFLAWRSLKLFRRDSVAKITAAGLLGLACTAVVTRWDGMIMSESLTISLSAALLASLLWLTHTEQKNLPSVLSGLFGLLLIPTRDSSVWMILLCGILLVIISLRSPRRKTITIVGVLLILACFLTMSATDDRWQYPFENTLFSRIMRSSQASAFFLEAGMPTPPGIEELYGEEHLMGNALFNSDEMAPLREWILSDGLKTYIRYLFRVPQKTLRSTWYNGFETESFERIYEKYDEGGFTPVLNEPLSKLFAFDAPGIFVILLAVAGLVFAVREKDNGWAFPVLFVLSAYILCMAVHLIDEYDFARHAVVNVILLKASAWVLLGKTVDWILSSAEKE